MWCIEQWLAAESTTKCSATQCTAQLHVDRLAPIVQSMLGSICCCVLQAVLPGWPGQMRHGLTQLVLVLTNSSNRYPDGAAFRSVFLRDYLLPLHSLRHLALHGMAGIGQHVVQEICAAAGALPKLISLHLVRFHLLQSLHPKHWRSWPCAWQHPHTFQSQPGTLLPNLGHTWWRTSAD